MFGGGTVGPPPGTPTQRNQVQNHPSRVAQKLHPAGRIVIPPHRHFDHLSAGAPDQEQQFGIKAEAGSSLQLERSMRGNAAKKLQSALRIADAQPGKKANQEVEEATAVFTEPRLTAADQLSA